MVAQLNHTIVPSRDKHRGAGFLTQILGLPATASFGHFVVVELGNGVSLDYDDRPEVPSQHYAFLVEDEDFDPIFERVQAAGVSYFADPGHQRAGEINTHHGGRGFYFPDPDGHNLEVITRPYT